MKRDVSEAESWGAVGLSSLEKVFELFGGDFGGKGGPMDVPVRIIWGAEDTWIPPDQAKRLQGHITNAEIFIVPEGGHFLMEDAPEEVTRLLVDFLTQPDAPR